MRRISRFLPSASTISSQVLSPCGLSRLTRLRLHLPVAEPDALEQLLEVVALGLPATSTR